MFNHLHPLHPKVATLLELFCLSQVVTGHTRESSAGRCSLLNLVLTTNPNVLHNCSVITLLATSDNLGIFSIFNLYASKIKYHPRKIWRYSHADFSKAYKLISDTNLESLLLYDIEQSWSHWHNKFMAIMQECIRTGVLPPRRCNLPWLNKGFIQSMHEKKEQAL